MWKFHDNRMQINLFTTTFCSIHALKKLARRLGQQILHKKWKNWTKTPLQFFRNLSRTPVRLVTQLQRLVWTKKITRSLWLRHNHPIWHLLRYWRTSFQSFSLFFRLGIPYTRNLINTDRHRIQIDNKDDQNMQIKFFSVIRRPRN